MHLKHHSGKLNLPDPPRQWIPQQLAAWNIREWPIRLAAIQRTSDLPDLHRDPFDRLLVAQSLEDGLAIVSPDPFFSGYGVTVVWQLDAYFTHTPPERPATGQSPDFSFALCPSVPRNTHPFS